jgi:hypothetical protein
MKDYLVFYSVVTNSDDSQLEIQILTGQLNNFKAKFSFLDYDYQDPFDDSTIVDDFNHEFGQLLIDSIHLLSIVQKTHYPYFAKAHDNGMIYFIKIEFRSDLKLNKSLSDYRSLYSRHSDGILRWNALKWFKLSELNSKTTTKFLSPVTQNLIKTTHMVTFLNNQFKSPQILSKYTKRNASRITSLLKKRKINQQKRIIQDGLWTQFISDQVKYFKNYHYHQLLDIYQYSTGTATKTNSLLRQILKDGFDPRSNPSEEQTALLTSAINLIKIIEKAPKLEKHTPRLTQLYRGLSFDPNLQMGDLTDIFKFNLNSTSLEIDIAANLFTPNEGCLFKLILPPNAPFLSIDHVSHYSYENEFILPPGCTFRVINRQVRHNPYLVTDQVYYTAVLHNYHSYLKVLTNFKSKTNQVVNLESPKSAQHMIPVPSDLLKQGHLVLRKLIDILAGLTPHLCSTKNLQIFNPITGTCIDLKSKQAKVVLHDQLILLIEKISPQQNQFDYNKEIKDLRNASLEDVDILDNIIEQYLTKLLARLSENSG